jgi:hypothetical protein
LAGAVADLLRATEGVAEKGKVLGDIDEHWKLWKSSWDCSERWLEGLILDTQMEAKNHTIAKYLTHESSQIDMAAIAHVQLPLSSLGGLSCMAGDRDGVCIRGTS